MDLRFYLLFITLFQNKWKCQNDKIYSFVCMEKRLQKCGEK
jgi:hypothetical protein